MRPKTMAQSRRYHNHNTNNNHNEANLSPELNTSRWTRTNPYKKSQKTIFSKELPAERQSEVFLQIQTCDYNDNTLFRKSRPLSRENIQMMNKKSRIVRSNQYSSSLGIYDLQKINMPRTSSAQSNYNTFEEKQFNPIIKSFRTPIKKQKNTLNPEKIRKSSSQTHNTMTKKNKEIKNHHNCKEENTKNPKIRDYTEQIFMPENQSETGHMIKKFKSNLKKKCIEDNLHVMATVLRKKVKVMDKNQIIMYVQKIMSRDPHEHVQK